MLFITKKMVILFLFLCESICYGAHWKRLIETLPLSTTKMFILKNKEHSNQHTSFTGNLLLRYFVKVEHRSCLAFFRAKYNFLINLKG